MVVSLFGVDLPSLMFKIFWHIKASRFHELGVGEDDAVAAPSTSVAKSSPCQSTLMSLTGCLYKHELNTPML